MIQTQYKITLNIDEQEFNIVVAEPNATQKKSLELKADEQKKRLDELSELNLQREQLNLEVNNKERIISINTELLKTSSDGEKTALLKENKALSDDILSLKKQIASLSNELKKGESINADFEALMEYKAQLLLSGDDKDKLFELVKERGVSFSLLWQEISEAVLKASQKK